MHECIDKKRSPPLGNDGLSVGQEIVLVDTGWSRHGIDRESRERGPWCNTRYNITTHTHTHTQCRMRRGSERGHAYKCKKDVSFGLFFVVICEGSQKVCIIG